MARSIVILDDHTLVREGVEQRLRADMPGVSFAYSGASLRDALNVVHTQGCDCAVVDLDLGDGTPVAEVVSAFTALGVPVVVVSAMARSEMVQSAIAAGAQAFVAKRSSMKHLAPAIDAVCKGGTWMPPDLALAMVQGPESVELSAQERRALTLYASGLTIDMVARRMNISANTVKHYIDRVRDKYTAAGVAARTKVELHEVARQAGLIS